MPPVAAGAEALETDQSEETLTVDAWNDRWTQVLGRVVDHRTGGVDYGRLRADRGTLAELRAELAGDRDFATERHRLAFLINAYNVLVLAAVLDEPQLPATVRDVRGFFDGERHQLLGKGRTLDEIRDKLIRPLGEPFAHFAFTNGAASSPPLLHVAYTAEELDAQLAYQVGRFLSDPVRNTAIGSTLMLSPIFRWFSDDFEAAASDGTLTGFLRQHAPTATAVGRGLAREDDPAITFLEFNWALHYVPVPDRPTEDAETGDESED
ncbi:MAG: DUF547 domain-containing protein [Phycisphaeraceae bacterium]